MRPEKTELMNLEAETFDLDAKLLFDSTVRHENRCFDSTVLRADRVRWTGRARRSWTFPMTATSIRSAPCIVGAGTSSWCRLPIESNENECWALELEPASMSSADGVTFEIRSSMTGFVVLRGNYVRYQHSQRRHWRHRDAHSHCANRINYTRQMTIWWLRRTTTT